jgi:hypothetical protein
MEYMAQEVISAKLYIPADEPSVINTPEDVVSAGQL